jgi:hypothetical protein
MMSAPLNTPWTVERSPSGSLTIIGADGNEVAAVFQGEGESDADYLTQACVIAAAPELQRALLDLGLCLYARPDIQRLMGPHEHNRYDEARAALDKASGE